MGSKILFGRLDGEGGSKKIFAPLGGEGGQVHTDLVKNDASTIRNSFWKLEHFNSCTFSGQHASDASFTCT